MSKYGVLSGPYFPVFSPNAGKYGQEKNSVFGHFSCSDSQSNYIYVNPIIEVMGVDADKRLALYLCLWLSSKSKVEKQKYH